MATRAIRNPDELALFKVYLDNRTLPITVDVTEGRDRTNEQNKLSHKWYSEIAAQTGEDQEDVRARCKLEIGVPILRRASDGFRSTYDRLIRDLAYDDKIAVIRDFDMPITRLMNVAQMTEYLDLVFRRHTEFGIELTVPPDRYAFDPDRRAA